VISTARGRERDTEKNGAPWVSPWVEGEDELIGFRNPERLGGRWGDRRAQRQPVTDALSFLIAID
jgi:hypothetical protein